MSCEDPNCSACELIRFMRIARHQGDLSMAEAIALAVFAIGEAYDVELEVGQLLHVVEDSEVVH